MLYQSSAWHSPRIGTYRGRIVYGTSTWAMHPEVVDIHGLEGLPMMAIACMSDLMACMVGREFCSKQ